LKKGNGNWASDTKGMLEKFVRTKVVTTKVVRTKVVRTKAGKDLL